MWEPFSVLDSWCFILKLLKMQKSSTHSDDWAMTCRWSSKGVCNYATPPFLTSACNLTTCIWVVLQSGYAAAEGNIMASVKNSKTCLWKVTILADWNLWGPPTAAKIPFKMINKWLKYACKRHFWQNQAFRFNFVNFWPSELFISNMI